ncbi:MAG TPA: septal ring lytic transglycosylase RlpA family protein [Rhizomicrobium sp.]|jgi:rare lipoprotein A|nr:septal ring lytic transglycosylase RlpA family protein [Rhizomicrobium sp.]
MRGTAQKLVVVCAFGALAAACSTAPEMSAPSSGGYKVGQPYEEGGVWYTPHEQPDYDETGIASWYGGEFHGRRTANGEIFDADGLTAAHPTLPMPVNVRVTNLENGRSLVLRVNDRGPFARGRIIDVSAHAAQLLGFYGKGTAKVRVTYLARADGSGGPPAGTPATVAATAVAAQAPTSQAAAPIPRVQVAALDPVAIAPAAASEEAAPVVPEASPPPAPLLRPAEPAPAPVTADSSPPHLYVQAGAFAARENAERLKAELSDAWNLTISSIDRNGRILYRVRLGPFDDIGAANAAVARLAGLGSSDARIVVDQ